jgi:NuA3 HAT complex component NTO1
MRLAKRPPGIGPRWSLGRETCSEAHDWHANPIGRGFPAQPHVAGNVSAHLVTAHSCPHARFLLTFAASHEAPAARLPGKHAPAVARPADCSHCPGATSRLHAPLLATSHSTHFYMAPAPDTPRPRVRSSARPPRPHTSDPAPPSKRRKYIPGGPGGGGRYVDAEGTETPVGGTGPGGHLYIGPRGRVGRENAEKRGVALPTPSPSAYARPRRERPPAGPRSSSAAAVAAAVAQHDGYKPREERSWDEFHPELDIDAECPVFTADQIDGVSPADSAPGTPLNGPSSGQYAVDTGISAVLDGLRAQQMDDAEKEGGFGGPVNGTGMFATPKRRPGRPPRNKDSMLAGLGSPPRPRINPLPTMNPREKLNLPKPSVRQVDPFKAHEESEGVKINYVDRTMANIGYQESEVFARAENNMIRLPEGSIEEDLDLALQSETDGPASAVPLGRVEYDMDEQDDRWLDSINLQRKEENADPIKPAIFEVTITQIEKEWHALEKRESLAAHTIPRPN